MNAVPSHLMPMIATVTGPPAFAQPNGVEGATLVNREHMHRYLIMGRRLFKRRDAAHCYSPLPSSLLIAGLYGRPAVIFTVFRNFLTGVSHTFRG